MNSQVETQKIAPGLGGLRTMSHLFLAFRQRRVILFLSFTILFSLLALDLTASAQVRDRISSFIDADQRVTLRGNVHPLASTRYDAGRVAHAFFMQHMLLTLRPDAAQQQALNQLLDAQHDPESPYYHQWLTPEQYGERFGVSQADTDQIAAWLEGHGLEVEEVTAGRGSIIFSGTAAQVESAFHSAIHTYK